MATTVADAVLIDTNILIYSTAVQSPWHGAARTALQALATAGHPRWISRQILREYLAAMSRPGTLSVPVPMTALVADVQFFETQFLIAEDGAAVMDQLLVLLAGVPCTGKQVHDANIVATMLAHGISHVLTHNVADFNRFVGHVAVIPLVP